MIGRDEWGAQPPARAYVDAPEVREGLELHHSVGTYGVRVGDGGGEVAGAFARAVQDDHLGRGWTDAFYNAAVMPDGLLVELRPWSARSGSVELLTVVLPGNYDHRRPSAAQLATIRQLRAEHPGRLAWHGQRDAVSCPGQHVKRAIKQGHLDEGDSMTPAQERKLDRALELLENLEAGKIGGRRNIGHDAKVLRFGQRTIGEAVGAEVAHDDEHGEVVS